MAPGLSVSPGILNRTEPLEKYLPENMKNNQEFMVEMNRITLERQIQMQNQMRERMVALQIARAREMLNWFGTFYAVAAVGMLTGFRHTRKPGVLVPLLPLTFIFGYQVDMAYGNKLLRIKHEAENIIKFESELLDLPMNLPTLSTIDMARQVQHDRLLMHSAEPPLYY